MYLLRYSKRKDKKYEIKYSDNGVIKSIHFGAKGYEDYTIHKDNIRKENYIKRHQVNENWKDLSKAGTFSRFLLWNKPSLSDSIKDMEKRFKIKITVIFNF